MEPGGYAGYKKYIESPPRQKPAVTSPAATTSDWVDSYAAGWIYMCRALQLV